MTTPALSDASLATGTDPVTGPESVPPLRSDLTQHGHQDAEQGEVSDARSAIFRELRSQFDGLLPPSVNPGLRGPRGPRLARFHQCRSADRDGHPARHGPPRTPHPRHRSVTGGSEGHDGPSASFHRDPSTGTWISAPRDDRHHHWDDQLSCTRPRSAQPNSQVGPGQQISTDARSRTTFGAQRPRRGAGSKRTTLPPPDRGFITMNGCKAGTGVLVGSHGSAVCRSACRAAAPPSSSNSTETNATATTPARKKITTTSATASTASRTRPGSRTAGPRCTRGRPGPPRRR